MEEGSDDDTIRFDAAGIEVATFTSTQTNLNTAITASSTLAVSGNTTVTGDFEVEGITTLATTTLGAVLQDYDGDNGTAGQVLSSTGTSTNWIDISSDSITDADGDTQIQVEEGSDDDTIRFDTAGTERMIIDSSGNVGIGTSTPTAELDINAIGQTLSAATNSQVTSIPNNGTWTTLIADVTSLDNITPANLKFL